MYSKTLRVGEAIEIGEVAAVRIEHKSGRMVRLAVFTSLPIRHLADGLIPASYTLGVTGEARRVVEPLDSYRRAAVG